MSTYGLKTFNAVGTVLIDISSRLNRFRYSTAVPAGESGNTTLADIDGLLTAQMSIMVNPVTDPTLFWRRVPHMVTRSGTTITWTAPTLEPLMVSNDSLVFVFLYV
jgi:hypothetical protein